MAKGVLGNDPFQKGAAGPAAKSEPEPVKTAGTSAPGKGAKKPEPAKKGGAKGRKSKASGAKGRGRSDGASARPAKAPAPPRTTPVSAAPHAAETPRGAPLPSEARALDAPVTPPVSPPPAEPVAAPPAGPRTAGPLEAVRQLEETLGTSLPTRSVAVPGFEDEEALVAEATPVEVPDDSEDEYAPDGVEAAVEETALVSTGPAADRDAQDFFTSESPGAEPHRMRTRFSGLLSLAREVAFQAVASERLGRTLGSAQGVLGAALTSLGMGGGTAVDEYGKDGALSGVLQPVADFLYEHYWRVSVQGASHVPTGPVLLVANHSGALPLDGPVLQQSLTRERPDLQEARWLAEDQVFHAPMLGTLMNRLGAVRACPENALRLLDEMRPLIVFPEGIQGIGKPFAQRYQLKRFGRGGFVKLALRTGAPIVPVAIVGAEETVPLLAKIPASFLGVPYLPVMPPPLPARWTIRFGEPIGVGDVPPEAAEDLSEVQRLTERTRESIQGMLQALLKERRSVFGG